MYQRKVGAHPSRAAIPGAARNREVRKPNLLRHAPAWELTTIPRNNHARAYAPTA